MTPKVIYRKAKFEEIIWPLRGFLNPPNPDSVWNWSDRIYNHYPDLKEMLEPEKEVKERENVIDSYFSKVMDEKSGELGEKAAIFQAEWDKINDDIMDALADICEEKWEGKDQIEARISLNPICPRYIAKRCYDLFFANDIEKTMAISIHENLHFIYFQKWNKVFPDVLYDEEEFEKGNYNGLNDLSWQLSEMVPGVLLNTDPIQNIFNYDFKSYSNYEEMKVEGKPLLDHLREFYKDATSFEMFLKVSFEFLRQKQELFLNK